MSADIQRCLDLGMQTVILKPIDQQVFFTAIEQHMNLSRHHETV
jgi:hypothetical protein